ncbi:MAG: VWA domain-containing protein [Acidobacteria bacterium]|nr:VWA domain-containing protein [Acidobacteriota bacterium]
MKRTTRWILIMGLGVALGWVGQPSVHVPAAPQNGPQADGQAPTTASGVLRTEANLVLVDVVAQDKKENYIKDLDAKEFHVFEDDNEQPITTFSHGTEKPQTQDQKKFLILFFDNSTMSPAEQARARQSAAQFVEKAASDDRLMAVADFGGMLKVTQNFTASTEDLKRAVAGIKFSALDPNASGQRTEIAQLGRPSLADTASNFAARSVLLAVRNLVKTLRPVPGRKTLVFFSAGFPLNSERQPELSATIDAANKANVAIYPVDVRGLTGLSMPGTQDMNAPADRNPGFPGFPPGAALGDGYFPHERLLLAASHIFGITLPQAVNQRPGGGAGSTGGGGGTTGGGGASGGAQPGGGAGAQPGGGAGAQPGGGFGGGAGARGGTQPGTGFGGPNRGGLGNPNNPYGQPGYGNMPRPGIIPPMLDSASSNQQVLYALATGTGGFTITNTNDFLRGLSKISQELDEYYVLGYVPPSAYHDGSYHKITVKTERKGVKLRFRTGYYDVKSPDLLAGKPEGKTLEDQAQSSNPGEIPVILSAPYFYTQPNVARVNMALEIPLPKLTFQKEKGKYQTKVNILGIAYREDGTVAARFSDSIKGEAEKKELKESSNAKISYENSFEISPGTYRLKIVMSGGGEKFGKYEMPLVIEPFDGKKLHLSGVALSDNMQPVSQITAGIEEQLLEERTPLVSNGIQLTPSPSHHFKKSEKVGMYVEVYEPLLAQASPPRVGITFKIFDKKSNQMVHTSNTILLQDFIEKDNTVIPVGLLVPIDKIQPGEYRLEVIARNGAGGVSDAHSTEFVVE